MLHGGGLQTVCQETHENKIVLSVVVKTACFFTSDNTPYFLSQITHQFYGTFYYDRQLNR